MEEILIEIKDFTLKKGDVYLTCRARARSVVTGRPFVQAQVVNRSGPKLVMSGSGGVLGVNAEQRMSKAGGRKRGWAQARFRHGTCAIQAECGQDPGEN